MSEKVETKEDLKRDQLRKLDQVIAYLGVMRDGMEKGEIVHESGDFNIAITTETEERMVGSQVEFQRSRMKTWNITAGVKFVNRR